MDQSTFELAKKNRDLRDKYVKEISKAEDFLSKLRENDPSPTLSVSTFLKISFEKDVFSAEDAVNEYISKLNSRISQLDSEFSNKL